MSRALVLGFDTSAAHCAAALVRGDEVVAARNEEMARGQAERLFPLLVDLLSEAGMAWSDLDALAVGTGPGVFTGVRVAVAAARGLALSTDLPAHGVDGFAARAIDATGPVLVGIAAPQGRILARRVGHGRLDEVLTLAPEEVRALAAREALELRGAALGAPEPHLAVAAAGIAARRQADGVVPGRPVPLYIRAPDAAPPREAVPHLLP